MKKQKSLTGAKNTLKTESKIKSLFNNSNFATFFQMDLKGVTDEQIRIFIHDKNIRFSVCHSTGIFMFYSLDSDTPLTGVQITAL